MSALPKPGPVPSPCIDVCRMNEATTWCEGCLRTIDEIAAWSTLDDPGKRAVWREIALRRERLAHLPDRGNGANRGG
jgi:predicted Fe-S protein YdhL (DUF1289 family)